MLVRLARGGPRYIQASVESSVGSKVLRRWPWPDNEVGRSKHLREASVYAHELARVLICPVEIDDVATH